MLPLLLAGSLTRDHRVVPGTRMTQLGGAPWHGGLAVAAADRVIVTAMAGPWCRAFLLPALWGSGVRWRGGESDADTVFAHQQRAGGRQLALRSRALPLPTATAIAALGSEAADTVAILSPLHPADLEPTLARALAEAGAFVALDLQGWLRSRDSSGFVRWEPHPLTEVVLGTSIVKLSEREFRVLVPEREIEPAVRRFAGERGLEVLVTRGAGGAIAATPTQAEAFVAPRPVEADATGAGDIFLAAYTLARTGGSGLAAALRHAGRTVAQRLDARRAHRPTVRSGGSTCSRSASNAIRAAPTPPRSPPQDRSRPRSRRISRCWSAARPSWRCAPRRRSACSSRFATREGARLGAAGEPR